MLESLLFGYDIQRVVGNMFHVVLIMIMFDVLLGVLASAKERKLNSSVNFDGLIRKAGLIVAVFFVSFIDAYLNTNGEIVKMGIGLIFVYEGLSIVENFSRIGVNLKFLTMFFDKDKVGKGDEK